MRKTLFLTLTFSALLFISCRKDETQPQRSGEGELVFTATIDNSLTKTTIDADPTSETAGKVSWEQDDEITIKDKANNSAVYKVSSITAEGKAVFEYVSGSTLGAGPYNATYGSAPLTSQTYNDVAGDLPMAAESETTSLTFSVTCGLLKITLKATDESISSIAVTGTPSGGNETTYLLSCTEEQSIAESKDFYIALPAGTYDKYVFRDSDGKVCTKTAKTDKSTVIAKNTIQPITFLTSLAFDYEYVDLGASGTANCYIVSEAGHYKFKAVKGGSSESAGDVKGVKVLWETFGTDVTPAKEDLVKADVSYSSPYVRFNTNDTYKEGNAVIAAYSDAGCSDGNVLWSWHIWLTDQPGEHVYKNSAGTMMDRNLGATSTTPGDVCALGLLYQWGRKDPFIGNISAVNESQYGTSAASTIEWPRSTMGDATKGTNEYAVAYPTKFITFDSLGVINYDWYYTNSKIVDNTRWNPSEKTIYDPCPYGWKVPEGGNNGIWAKAFGSGNEFTSGPFDKTNRGMNFGSGNGKESSMQLGSTETIWYPAAGCRSYRMGGLKWPGSNGYYWTCSPTDSTFAVSFFFDVTHKVVPSSGRERSAARSVRCQKQ